MLRRDEEGRVSDWAWKGGGCEGGCGGGAHFCVLKSEKRGKTESASCKVEVKRFVVMLTFHDVEELIVD